MSMTEQGVIAIDRAPRYDDWPRHAQPICADSVWHKPGNIILIDGMEHVAVRVTECSVVCRRSGIVHVDRETRFGEKIQFNVMVSRTIRLAPTHRHNEVPPRLSEEQFADFLNGKKPKEPTMKTEPGEVLQYSAGPGKAGRFTVTAVSAKHARIASLNAEPDKLTILIIDRDVKEYFFTHHPRLHESERRNELNNFLAANASAAAELTSEITGGKTETETETEMPKKTTAKKAPTEPKVPKERKQSKCAFIDDLFVKGGLTKTKILEKTLAAFPGSTQKSTMATINARPAHVKAAGKTPKWEDEPKAEK